MRHLKTTLLFLMFCGILSPLFAQEAPTLRFRTFSLQSKIDGLALVSAKGLIQCKIPSHRRSPTIDYFGGKVLRFIDKKSYIEGEPLPPSLAEVKVPKNIRQPLFIFLENRAASGMKYQVLVVEDSLKDMPGGASMFVNLSELHLLLLLGEEGKITRVKLKPKTRNIQKIDQRSLNVRVRIASYAEGAVRKGMDSRVFPAQSHRDIYFIYPVKGNEPGRLRMKSLRENVITAKFSKATKADKTKTGE